MKKEIFRIENGMIQQGRIVKGPFFLQFREGEISGIITDNSFEKELFQMQKYAERGGLLRKRKAGFWESAV